VRVGTRQPPPLLDVQQIPRLPEAVADRPGCPLREKLLQALGVEAEILAMRSDAGGDVAEERLDQILDAAPDLLPLEIGAQ
jgi:hypothetical protein